MNTYNLLEKAIKELPLNKNVAMIENSGFKPLSHEQANSLTEELQQGVYKNKVDLFTNYIKFPMKIRVAWEYKLTGAFEMGGRMDLHNIAIAIQDEAYHLINTNSQKQKSDQPSAGEKKYFDKDLKSGESFGATISLEEKLSSFEVGVFMDKVYYKMNITLDDYVRYLCITKGFTYWQFLFCKNLSDDLKKDIRDNYAKRMMRVLPKLFGDEDYTDLKRIVDAF